MIRDLMLILAFLGCSAPDAKVSSSEVASDAMDQIAEVSCNEQGQAAFRLVQAGPETYAGGIEILLQNKCVSCHGAAAVTKLNGYANAAANARSSLDEILADRMPQVGPALSAAEKAQFQAWVDGGMPEGNVAAPTTAPSPSPTAPQSQTSTTPSTVEAEPAASAAPDAVVKCVVPSNRDECRARDFLWNGAECLGSPRLECSTDEIIAAFAASGMDVAPYLTLPVGASSLLIEGCSERSVRFGAETRLVPVAVLYFQGAEGSLVYRVLTITP